MTDVHSHILFDVDDGSRTIEESIEILKKLKDIGFDNVILTPHYIDGSGYNSKNDEKIEKLNILKDELIKNNIDINIYIGNEIFIDANVIGLIKEKKVFSLNRTKYILIEFPFYKISPDLQDVMDALLKVGFVPVIAHPERYEYFQNDYTLVDDLRNIGVMFQGNYASILGHYGKSAKKLFKYMLKNKYIDYLGTDVHRKERCFAIDNFTKIEKKIIRVCGKDYYNQIKDNCDKLVK